MKKQMTNNNGLKILILLTAILLAGCERGAEKASVNSSPTPVIEEKKFDDFGESLKTVQRGNFDFIFSFRRADGEILSSDDKKYLKENSPRDTNQWVLTADGKTAIAGSNYKFTPENFDALKKKFIVDDYSDAAKGGDQNSNSQDNSNIK